jgi:hypothetical protein
MHFFRYLKHLRIAASAEHWQAMHNLRINFEQGNGSRETIDSTLAAYNNCCAEMRSFPTEFKWSDTCLY